tara:strand:+ start:1631 stop:3376 length:1746 start_codon:yes stop_codon:yes gene_type:complete
MEKSRLPANLQNNRRDIKDLNDRASLLKVIKKRENNTELREDLLKEYKEIMKKLFKSQQKKKGRRRAGRGGVRRSRAEERREAERFKRGERRDEGDDDSKIIGEEIKKDELGNLQITYRDVEKENAEKLRLENRLDTIRLEDRKIRKDEQDNNLAFQEDRDIENRLMQREFRDREDDFKQFQLDMTDRGARTKRQTDRVYQDAKLNLLEQKLEQGEDVFSALQNLDNKFTNMFDAATFQYNNLLATNPEGLEIENLVQANPRVIEPPVIEDLGISTVDDDDIPFNETDSEEEQDKKDKRKAFLDNLSPGVNYTSTAGDEVGTLNPILSTEEKTIAEDNLADEGLFTVGSKKAEEVGIVQSIEDEPAPEITPDSNPKFDPGKYTKGQDVMYFRGDKWMNAKIADYKSDDAGETQLAVLMGDKTIDTVSENVIPTPTQAEKTRQSQLREELKSGIWKDKSISKKDSGGSAFWEDRDKYLIHNQTDKEFKGIPARGKSVLNYHKEHNLENDPTGGRENTYLHTPTDADGTWTKAKSIGPKFLDPALESGILRLEKYEEKLSNPLNLDTPKDLSLEGLEDDSPEE